MWARYLKEQEFRSGLRVIVRGTPGGYGLTKYHVAEAGYRCDEIRQPNRALTMSQSEAEASGLLRCPSCNWSGYEDKERSRSI
jgi:hypothetical protein